MSALLDLAGASGAVYRFRRHEAPGALPAIAGNFVAVESQTGKVVCCGAVDSLAFARDPWDTAVARHGADRLYVRYNVARTTREAEHADLVTALKPPMKVLGGS